MTSRRDDKTFVVLVVGLLASVGLHAGLLTWASLQKVVVHEVNKPVEMQIVQIEPPKPPEPPPEPPKPVEEPKPKIKPPPIKVAEVKPPPVAEPPPPIEEAKEPPKPVPLVVGISMSSTTSAGGFAAAVGNTAYGKTADKAVAPSEVHAYNAPKYVPPGSADSDPETADEIRIPYPDEARKAGIEGTVRLRIVVDNEGRVVDAKVLNGPGYGLDQAAREAIKKFRFKPAMKNGEAVSTTLTYSYTFLLD
jgi:protein TonB